MMSPRVVDVGALTGAFTSIGIPKEGVPRCVADLKADHGPDLNM